MDFGFPFKFKFAAAVILFAQLNTSYADILGLPGSVMPEQVAKHLTPKPSLIPSGVAPQPVQSHETAQQSALNAAAFPSLPE